MSQKAEQVTNAKDTWKQVEQGTATSEAIQHIYASIWNDREPAPGAMLTDAERTQYGRQNSVGVPVKNVDGIKCKELPQASTCAEKSLPDVTINNDHADHKGKYLPLSALTDRNDKRPVLRADGGKGDGCEDRPLLSPEQVSQITDKKVVKHPSLRADDGAVSFEPTWPVGKDPGEARFEPTWPVGKHPGEVIAHNSEKQPIEDRTQKVSYPDGSSRVVLRDKDGQILAVVNPDGSRLERQPGKPGEAPFWQAYGRYDTPITADSFRGNVEMSADGTFRMAKIYPVPQIYEQKPDGSYRKAYKGGAAEQWTAATQTDTMLYPTGKAREIKFAASENGILEATSVTDR